mmetsp:Transcript_7677/g.10530  ORF Transcript_7677/g.10530 Transcript_7677/m.10530 type:complete len:227 (-) Transcript_7677:272-952(-)
MDRDDDGKDRKQRGRDERDDKEGERGDRVRTRDRENDRNRDRDRRDRDRERDTEIRRHPERERRMLGRMNRERDRSHRDHRENRDRSPKRMGNFNRMRRDRDRPSVDRQKICPLLLRVFCKQGGHHKAEDFKDPEKEPTDDEFQIYTWKDATLGELTSLIKGVRKAARRRTARLSFAFVYPDRTGNKVVRLVGETFSTRRSSDGHKTLGELHFETGDYLDVAIFLS